jgi:class 3 adenylate cyclase
MQPPVQYVVTADGVRIAYTVSGSGPGHVMLVDLFGSHVQNEWRWPILDRAGPRLSEASTLVRIDLRGTGLSDRDVPDLSPEAMLRDVEAVAERIGLETHALTAVQNTTPVGIRYAARHPERVTKLVLVNGFARGAEHLAQPVVKAFIGVIEHDWELFTESAGAIAFGYGAEAARGYGEFLRSCFSAETAKQVVAMLHDIDVTEELKQLTMPVLVLHHTEWKLVSVDTSRDLAARIPEARLILLPGLWVDADFVTPLLEFLASPEDTESKAGRAQTGGLRAILFTDVEGHTVMMQRLGDAAGRAALREHEEITREMLKAHGGVEVKAMGDGFMAWFASVTSAAECSVALQTAFSARNETTTVPMSIRIGINAGEPVEDAGDLFGSSVILAARIAAKARGGEILVSDVVRGLLAGKGFLFADRGETLIHGFEEACHVYELRRGA